MEKAYSYIHRIFILNQSHTVFLTFLAHFIRPDTCLDFTNMRLMKQDHAEAALSYTTTDTQRQLII